MNIKVTVQGLSRILFHNFSTETIIEMSEGARSTMDGERGTPREQARKTLYVDSAGNIVFPSANLLASIMEAGRFHKLKGNTKITTSRTSIVPAAIAIEEMFLDFGTKDFEVDSRRVVNPKTRGAVICHRAALDVPWRLTFHLEVDDTMLSADTVRKLVDDAGKKLGIGSFRPQCKGPFGRFTVVLWEVQKVALKPAA